MPNDIEMVGRTLGPYTVGEQLGAGGMGVVYRAHDPRLQREVALKVLRPGVLADEAARKRFRREALALSRLNHPNVATVHDFGSEGLVDYLVMELIPGVTLDAKISTGRLSEKEVVQIGLQLADGLAAAHLAGVLHRDLKPGNLRLTPDGRLKILDFGLARFLADDNPDASTQTATATKGAVGTLPYMAPEQLRGANVDERTDIYAAGTVLYEIVTGRRPFVEQDSARLISAILADAPPPPSELRKDISPALQSVILKAVDKDPANRYQSARELREDLERLAAGTAPRATSARPPRWSRRFAAAVIAAVVIATLAAAIGPWRNRFFPSASPHSVAVLPLMNVSGDAQHDYFAVGITLELISDLGEISSLRVTAPRSVMPYKNSRKPVPEIARALSVEKILDGTVRRVGNRAVVNLQLFDASGRQLWSGRYDREASDAITLQRQIATKIASELGATIKPNENAQLARTPSVDPVALDLYLKGVHYIWLEKPDGAKYKGYLEEAIARDPNFAPAYVALAEGYLSAGFFGSPRPPMETFPKVRELAEKALRIDETYAPAHVLLGIVKLHHEWDWEGARREFERAMELNPSLAPAHHWYAHYLLVTDKIDASVEASKRAAALDPLSAPWSACYGWHCLLGRQFNVAIAESRRVLAQDPNFVRAHVNIGRALTAEGKFEEALPELRKGVELSKGNSGPLSSLAYTLGRAGQRQEAEKTIGMLKARAAKTYVPAYDFAVAYAGLDDRGQVFEWLDRAYLERSYFLIHVKWDERFENLRSDPRFLALLRRIGLG